MDTEISGDISGICRENRFLRINKELSHNDLDKNINGNGLKNHTNSPITEGTRASKMAYLDRAVRHIGRALKFGKLEANLTMT